MNGKTDEGFATVEKLLIPSSENPIVASDVDPQLLIKVAFKEKVNLTAITFRCDTRPEQDEDEFLLPV